MANDQGEETEAPVEATEPPGPEESEGPGALGDTIPKDWIDFAIDQSERTRAEFIERMTFEVARSLENVDLATVLTRLLEGRTLEVKAEVRLGAKDGRSGANPIQVVLRDEERET